MKYKTLIGIGLVFGMTAHAQGTSNGTGTGSGMSQSDPAQPSQADQNQVQDQNQGMMNPQTKIDQGTRVPAAGGEQKENIMSLSPKDVCQKLVEAEKSTSSDKSQIDQWISRGPGRSMAKSEGRMLRHDMLRRDISNADCQSETMADSHAFVVAKSGDKQRLLPFVKEGNRWKFDLQAYRVIYRSEARMPASSGK